MEIPKFLRLENNALLFNEDNKELHFYVPENFFDEGSKKPIAKIDGQYVSMIGICEWCIVDSNGKRSELKPFTFPTMILCKPYKIEKVKSLKTDIEGEPKDYRILHFAKDDEVISQTRVPQIVDNVELLTQIMFLTGRVPNSVSYDQLWKLPIESMELNGNKFALHSQLFGMVASEICRDPKDINRPYRVMKTNDLHNYNLVSVKLLPKYKSPFTSLISEQIDTGIMGAVLLKDVPEDQLPDSSLEKILMQ